MSEETGKIEPERRVMQFQLMPQDMHWQGHLMILTDDGRMWIDAGKDRAFVPYVLTFEERP